MDRIDLVVPIAPSNVEPAMKAGENSDAIRARIDAARARQRRRLVGTQWRTNAEIPADAGAIDRLCPLDAKAAALLRELVRVRRLSPRAQHRLRRVARTLADLREPPDASDGPLSPEDVAQAAAMRCLPE